MENKKIIAAAIIVLIYMASLLAFASAVVVDADYITVYPGQSGKVTVKVDNNENFDIERVSLALDLGNVPFASVGSSEKTIDDIREDDDDSVSFTLVPSTDIAPGDYEIPYTLTYLNMDDNTQNFSKEGSFGIRVSAKTDLDFSAEVDGNAILGDQGSFSIDVINRGLGEVKSVSVQVFPNGYELLSADKVFIGTISADDDDSANFDVIYNTVSPTVTAKITYKDFDNKDQTQTVSIPLKIYTKEQALDLGIISKPSYTLYIVIAILIVAFFIYRTVKKRRRNK